MRTIIISLFCFLFIVSCNKTESTSAAVVKTEKNESQSVKILKNEKGEEASLTYFAEGDKVAVKIKLPNQDETTLHAETVNEKGNPVFSNGKISWEINEDGVSGTLIDEKGNKISYQ